MTTIDGLMRAAPVIPVLTVTDASISRPLAAALVAGGLTTLEVTLRTPAALQVIGEMAQVDGAVVGAGTVLNTRDLDAAQRAGARFAVSPGLTRSLVQEALDRGFPLLPGVATASDLMQGLDLGLNRFKFFPAATAGGIPALKALAAPFAQCRFCPTGGITQESAADWLALEAVICVGGSWFLTESFNAEDVQRRAEWALKAIRPRHGAGDQDPRRPQ
jgi:2-dehydro-3-deoxyphosphogluconate aldolase / (4S)-4-hydroxy-2-oxoglutarate aldolase